LASACAVRHKPLNRLRKNARAGRKDVPEWLKSMRENDHHEIESRRACPELVERGRLNLAQDAVLGWHAPLESPAGTTEKLNTPHIFGGNALKSPPGKVQSSLRDFSSLESPPRTASWAKFNRPCGTHFAIGKSSRTHYNPTFSQSCAGLNSCPDTKPSFSTVCKAVAAPFFTL
jgi:hypothetical protein